MDTSIDAPSSHSSEEQTETSPKQIDTVNVKFEFRTTQKDFDFESIHREIVITIANKYLDAIFFSNQPDDATFDAFTNDDMPKAFNYQILPRSNHFVACFAHRIKSSATFDDLKQLLKPILHANQGYIRLNKWPERDLDIVPAGWLLKSHPIVHHRDYIHDLIKQYCHQNDIELVPIQLQTRSITFNPRTSNQRIRTNAIHILCRNNDLSKCRHLMQTLYSKDNFRGPGKFVPSNIASTQGPSSLQQLIEMQKHYLENHRSISVLGVSFSSLSLYHSSNTADTLLDIIFKSSCIDWISPTSRTNTHGRILFSTSTDKYYSAIHWIDNTFLSLHHSLDDPTSPTEFNGKAYRLVKGQQSTKSDEYSRNLIQSIKNFQPTKATNHPNAWNKPLTIKPRIPDDTDATSTTTIGTTSEFTISTSELTNIVTQIESLMQSFNNFKNDVQQQLQAQNAMIANIDNLVDISVNKHLQSIHENIDTMKTNFDRTIKKLNDSWTAQLQSITSCPAPSSTTNSVCPKTPKTVSFQNTRDPDSGSTRARKQPRTTTNLDMVQKNLFDSGITVTPITTDAFKHHKKKD